MLSDFRASIKETALVEKDENCTLEIEIDLTKTKLDVFIKNNTLYITTLNDDAVKNLESLAHVILDFKEITDQEGAY